ncbi:uncharacterized protein LOC109826868 [Asparagus officinalis]|uniref:uncharacterized protein LOC109826868 n=1 Tax=Asparagus officinalis TaxID=4686 RepID=UPI00098E021E|nr:uncharacterized protein LOC109826868 [Asparagus officinalis]
MVRDFDMVSEQPSPKNPSSSTRLTPPPRRRKILRFVVVVPAAALLAFALGLHAGFALHPKNLHVFVSQAELKRFSLVGNRTVHSKLDAAIVFRNPNKWARVRYKPVHATGFYEKSTFGSVRLGKSKQARDSIKTFDVELEGESAMPVNWRVGEFYEAKEKGFADVEVRVYSRIRYKIGWLKTRKRSLVAICGLNGVALASNESFGGGGGGFRGTRCDVY